MSEYEQVQALRQRIENDLGPVDILVNNAGLLTNVSLLEGSAGELQRVINVNLTSHLWVNGGRRARPARPQQATRNRPFAFADQPRVHQGHE